MSLEEKSARLDAVLRASGSLLVAYSGGTDSAFLAFAAYKALGVGMLAVIADSASLPRRELADALAFAEAHGIPVRILATQELANEAYARNDAQRCFHCKTELFAGMEALRVELGLARIAYGMNVDDRGEYRPGQAAAEERAVMAPLVEAGLTKAEVRELARGAGLAVADKPASACLASRIEYGRAVDAENLGQVERAEEALHGLGFLRVRVRHHGELARIEIAREDMERALSAEMFARMTKALAPMGFKYLAMDMHGYRTGSMNAVLPVSEVTFAAGSKAAR